MTDRLKGKAAFVTGSASGIGRGIATEMAREGAIVGIVDLKRDRVDACVNDLEAEGLKAFGYAGDVTSREFLGACVREFAAAAGGLDVLVSNAIWTRYESIDAVSEKTIDRTFAVGFKAVVWGLQLAAELMEQRGGGSVIHVGSIGGFRSLPNSLIYSGVKAAVGGLTRAAAVELGQQNIRVNTIAPGTTLTDGVRRNVTDEGLQHRVSRVPLRRLGAVEDIARAAVYLASDDSAWVTGTTLVVDGGTTAAHL